MKSILVCPDSFKGTLTAKEVAEAISRGVKISCKAETVLLPLSDGGEGFTEAFAKAWDCPLQSIQTVDPLNRPIKAFFIFNAETRTAVVEMAQAGGITFLKDEERNPEITTTYGTGLMMLEAISKGAEKIILGLGGSATNDAGTGIARALGVKFLDQDGKEIIHAKNLIYLRQIDDSNSVLKEKKIEIICACDVENPLTGENGATYTFGPQKGGNNGQLENLEAALSQFKNIVQKQFNIDLNSISGTGAAGGIASTLLFMTETKLVSGFDLLAAEYELEKEIEKTDYIITGEGKFDQTSLGGKLVGKVIQLAKSKNKPVLVICGKNETEYSPVIELLELDKERAFSDTGKLIEEGIRDYFLGIY